MKNNEINFSGGKVFYEETQFKQKVFSSSIIRIHDSFDSMWRIFFHHSYHSSTG